MAILPLESSSAPPSPAHTGTRDGWAAGCQDPRGWECTVGRRQGHWSVVLSGKPINFTNANKLQSRDSLGLQSGRGKRFHVCFTSKSH